MTTRWAVQWNKQFYFDGEFGSKYGSRPLLFPTRKKATEYIREEWGFIRNREDLRRPPYNWRMPKAVRVEVILREVKR